MIDYLTILLSTSAKSEMLAQRDPYGFIMTVTAVAVVFGALLVLYVFFGILGGFNSGKIDIKKWFRCRKKTKQEPDAAPAETSATFLRATV